MNNNRYQQEFNPNDFIKDIIPLEHQRNFQIKDIMGNNIAEKRYKELNIKYVHIQPKLKGGSTKIGFINANGLPAGSSNLHKVRVQKNFMRGNNLNVFLETGVTNRPIRTTDST